MNLYGYYRSSTSYRVRIALNLKGKPFSTTPINLKTDEHRADEFHRINRHCTVPTLDIGTRCISQSLAIIDWLDNAFPEPSFLPEAVDQSIICRELYYAVATEIHAPNNLAILRYLKSEFGADQEDLELWNQHWIARTFQPIEMRLNEMTWANQALPFGRPTLFEIVLIPQVYNAHRWLVDLSKFPNLNRINDYCVGLEPFKAAHPDTQTDAPED